MYKNVTGYSSMLDASEAHEKEFTQSGIHTVYLYGTQTANAWEPAYGDFRCGCGKMGWFELPASPTCYGTYMFNARAVDSPAQAGVE